MSASTPSTQRGAPSGQGGGDPGAAAPPDVHALLGEDAAGGGAAEALGDAERADAAELDAARGARGAVLVLLADGGADPGRARARRGAAAHGAEAVFAAGLPGAGGVDALAEARVRVAERVGGAGHLQAGGQGGLAGASEGVAGGAVRAIDAVAARAVVADGDAGAARGVVEDHAGVAVVGAGAVGGAVLGADGVAAVAQAQAEVVRAPAGGVGEVAAALAEADLAADAGARARVAVGVGAAVLAVAAIRDAGELQRDADPQRAPFELGAEVVEGALAAVFAGGGADDLVVGGAQVDADVLGARAAERAVDAARVAEPQRRLAGARLWVADLGVGARNPRAAVHAGEDLRDTLEVPGVLAHLGAKIPVRAGQIVAASPRADALAGVRERHAAVVGAAAEGVQRAVQVAEPLRLRAFPRARVTDLSGGARNPVAALLAGERSGDAELDQGQFLHREARKTARAALGVRATVGGAGRGGLSRELEAAIKGAAALFIHGAGLAEALRGLDVGRVGGEIGGCGVLGEVLGEVRGGVGGELRGVGEAWRGRGVCAAGAEGQEERGEGAL